MTDTGIENLQVPPELGFERLSPLRRALKRVLINPLANYTPAFITRGLLWLTRSELAAANWKDPGGWRSMVISYDGKCRQLSDRFLVAAGTIPMALRNRRRLASHLIARLIESTPADPVHVLCLGAGPGLITLDALAQAKDKDTSHATLVDLSSDAFNYGLEQANLKGLAHRVRYIQADVRDLEKYLDRPPHVVKMIGICEYLSDEQILSIARASAALMPAASAIVVNSISKAHGTDRFFRRVFGLHLIHRNPRQIMDLLGRVGLGEFVVYPEPLGVYHVIVGRKL